MNRTSEYKPLLFVFSIFALVWTGLLLFAGGFTTSIDAGMAFLDWPLSNGSINPEGWLEDPAQTAEHSHRLLGMKLGLLSIVLLGWTWLREARPWVRRTALALFALILFQGLLGGARVLFDQLNIGTESNTLARSFAIAHALGAQLVLAALAAVTVGQSRFWIERRSGLCGPVPAGLRNLGLLLCGAIFLQILLGAVVRHANAGLAIPTFPASTPEGAWLPPGWNWAVTLNFGHRIGAVLVTALLATFAWRLIRSHEAGRPLKFALLWLGGALTVQIWLGAVATWSALNPHAATAHMLVGAFTLAMSWTVTFNLYNRPLSDAPDHPARRSRARRGSLREPAGMPLS